MTDSRTPRRLVVSRFRRVDVAVADQHACARLRTGRVVCRGHPLGGILGVRDALSRPGVPVEVPGLDGVIGLEARGHATCAVRQDGRVTVPEGGPPETSTPLLIPELDAISVVLHEGGFARSAPSLGVRRAPRRTMIHALRHRGHEADSPRASARSLRAVLLNRPSFHASCRLASSTTRAAVMPSFS